MEWINSKYRLPEKEGVYLVYAPSADPSSPLIVTAFWSLEPKGHWGLPLPPSWAEAITHWMPLPAPPKEGA